MNICKAGTYSQIEQGLKYPSIDRYSFDGWILKPIDFTRLDYLLRGVHDRALRRDALYEPGTWGMGGWFLA
jgi:hypothetical protein